MPHFTRRARIDAVLGMALTLALIGAASAADAAEPTPVPVSASPTPTAISSSAPTSAPSPSSGTVERGATTVLEGSSAALVSISGRVVFDKRTTAAQRAAVSIEALPVRGNPLPKGAVTYDARTGNFRITGLSPAEYTLDSRMTVETGSFVPANAWTAVDTRKGSVSGVTIDYGSAEGGIQSELIIFEEETAFNGVSVIATDTTTKADSRFVLFGGGLGGIYAHFAAPTGTTVTVRAEYTDGRVVYYDGTSTGSPDASRAVAVTTGLWEWKQITLDWAAAALPKLSASTPTIPGTARVGATLTAKTGTWTKGAKLTYQWLANGAAITGATASTFTPVAAQQGKKLSVRVTGTLAGYTSVSKTSKPTAAVAAGILTAPTPTIRGTARVGTTLTAVPGTWTSGTTLTYQWFANGAKIRGATSASFTPTSAQRGAKLTVTVTGTKAGYTSKSVTSKATTAVAR